MSPTAAAGVAEDVMFQRVRPPFDPWPEALDVPDPSAPSLSTTLTSSSGYCRSGELPPLVSCLYRIPLRFRSIHEVATTKHPGVEPDDFFEDVKEDAKFIIGLCDLDEIQE